MVTSFIAYAWPRSGRVTFGARLSFPIMGPDVLIGSLSTNVVRNSSRETEQAHVAQKIQTLFIDDIDGSEAEGTVRFALDGAEYEIDLNAKNANALRKALSRYVEAARRSSGTAARRPARAGRRSAASGL